MRYYEPFFLSEWLAANGVNVPFSARTAGITVLYEERTETGPEGETFTSYVPVEVSQPGETVFLEPLPANIQATLEAQVDVSVYEDTPNVGDITVEFTVPGATGSADIRVYDDDYALISTTSDAFDASGVVGVVLSQPAPGAYYYVLMWRSDLPPVHARVEVK